MKNRKTLIVILLSFVLAGSTFAQDCSYYSMSEGMVFGYQNLDAKGKVTGSSRTTCLGVETVGAATIFKVKSEYFDSKKASQSSTELEMRCEDGKFYVDMKNFIDPKSMESFKDMEISVDSKDMLYPNGLSAGQTLPDASITISAATGGISIMNLFVTITNRKVVGTESVTVPAGTFECYKITYDVETKMMFKMNTSVAEYINMGVGNVKTETFDKKGKLAGTTELVELKK
jgi:hypothetical protein